MEINIKLPELRNLFLIVGVLMTSVIVGNAQFNYDHVTLSTDSCVVDSNEIKFKVIICNDGDTLVSLNSMELRISLNSALLNGSPTITCNRQDILHLFQQSDFPDGAAGTKRRRQVG